MHKRSYMVALVLAGVACGGDDSTTGGAGSTGQIAGSMTPSSGGSGGASSTGGAAGSNAAGATIAGGSSGASAGAAGTTPTSDGGSMCTVRNPNACDACVFTKCCDKYAPCSLDDDCLLGIGNLAECVANDEAMVAQCYDDFASTNDLASALRTCVKTSCDTACTTVTP